MEAFKFLLLTDIERKSETCGKIRGVGPWNQLYNYSSCKTSRLLYVNWDHQTIFSYVSYCFSYFAFKRRKFWNTQVSWSVWKHQVDQSAAAEKGVPILTETAAFSSSFVSSGKNVFRPVFWRKNKRTAWPICSRMECSSTQKLFLSQHINIFTALPKRTVPQHPPRSPERPLEGPLQESLQATCRGSRGTFERGKCAFCMSADCLHAI